MRAFLLLTFLVPLQGAIAYAQFSDGFDKERARDLVRICNSFTSIDLFNSDEEILPEGYEKLYTSSAYGMDNKFQVYKSGDIGVIHFRGSTAERISWLENINSGMIPAEGTMKMNGTPFDYCFAKDEAAAVHSGYALGIGFLREDILFQLKELNRKGVHDVIITGYSQGGALANLAMAWLHQLPAEKLSPKNSFKTYAFAAPMVGNKAFAREYDHSYCVDGMSYNIINPKDPIPRFPLSYHESKEGFVMKNLKKAMSEEKDLYMQELVTEGAALLLEDEMKKLVDRMGQKTDQQIEREVGPFELPPRVDDIDYEPICNRKRLRPVKYPKVMKDSSILSNDSLMAVKERGPNGHLKDESLYEDEPWGYQHKPYNYYYAFLKTYFPRRYRKVAPRHERMKNRGKGGE